MQYIDVNYYKNDFQGEDAGANIEKYIKRASDMIDQIIGYRFQRKSLEEHPTFVQDLVKKATAAQVEFYVVKGGDSLLNAGEDDMGNVKIGSFQYQKKAESKQSNKANRVSPATISYLEPTGLLYQGLDVIQNVYYSSDS